MIYARGGRTQRAGPQVSVFILGRCVRAGGGAHDPPWARAHTSFLSSASGSASTPTECHAGTPRARSMPNDGSSRRRSSASPTGHASATRRRPARHRRAPVSTTAEAAARSSGRPCATAWRRQPSGPAPVRGDRLDKSRLCRTCRREPAAMAGCGARVGRRHRCGLADATIRRASPGAAGAMAEGTFAADPLNPAADAHRGIVYKGRMMSSTGRPRGRRLDAANPGGERRRPRRRERAPVPRSAPGRRGQR